MSNYFKDSLQKFGRRNIQYQTNKSLNWFRQHVRSTSRTHVQDMNDVRKMVRNTQKAKRIEMGKMYLFAYDAKHKDKLPYWDASPLIFPISDTGKHFVGINFHYLPLPLRAKLMDALYPFLTSDELTDNARLAITYKILKSAAAFKYIKPCVKQYLKNNVRSRLIEIPVEYWEVALFLPIAEWQGPQSANVYEESARIINRK